MQVLVTGAAGFIGHKLSEVLLARGDSVVGIDNLNDYYAVALKQARLARLSATANFTFYPIDIADQAAIQKLFREHRFDRVVNLAAQAGVRYSIDNPMAYIEANLTGFGHILEACRHNHVEHLVYASSSSVYGANESMPFRVEDNVDHPVSLYAASKKANELMAHTYSSLYQLPTTGLRYFTVYGPWGRPDMALFKFTEAMLAGKAIDVYNYGNHQRDFTYIDDIVDGTVKALDRIAQPNPNWQAASPDPSSSYAPYKIYNIGCHQPVNLLDFIQTLERCLGIEAKKNMLPMQAGDVQATFADVSQLMQDTGYQPSTSIDEGIQQFVHWYKDFYAV
ncbi:MAG: NAD-dependent epimerase [Pseudomonadales bacterium]|nr:NAD-dependent epimerase [Pseudomonadales bacterium]